MSTIYNNYLSLEFFLMKLERLKNFLNITKYNTSYCAISEITKIIKIPPHEAIRHQDVYDYQHFINNASIRFHCLLNSVLLILTLLAVTHYGSCEQNTIVAQRETSHHVSSAEIIVYCTLDDHIDHVMHKSSGVLYVVSLIEIQARDIFINLDICG